MTGFIFRLRSQGAIKFTILKVFSQSVLSLIVLDMNLRCKKNLLALRDKEVVRISNKFKILLLANYKKMFLNTKENMKLSFVSGALYIRVPN